MTRLVVKLTGLVLALAVVAGCGKEEEPKVLLPMALRRPTPVDSTLPGEMAEGREKAFGFPMPRDMKIIARMEKVWTAETTMSLESVANYVRARVETDKVETGPSRTVFMEAKPRYDASKTVKVTVARKSGKTLLIVRDKTRVPAEKGLTEEERWRQAGIGPDGKPIGDENK